MRGGGASRFLEVIRAASRLHEIKTGGLEGVSGNSPPCTAIKGRKEGVLDQPNPALDLPLMQRQKTAQGGEARRPPPLTRSSLCKKWGMFFQRSSLRLHGIVSVLKKPLAGGFRAL